MSNAQLESQFNIILAGVAGALKQLGFGKRGNRFYRFTGENLALIEFQRSAFNGPESLRFTLNIGIASATLARIDECDIKKMRVHKAHFQERIGKFLSQREDYWWELDDHADAEAIKTRLVTVLESVVVPYLRDHISDAALLAMWEVSDTARIPGSHRHRYFQVLKAAASQ